MNVLQVVCLSFIALATVAACISFIRGICWISTTLRKANASPNRLRPVGMRLASTLKLIATHSTFKHRPVVKIAHWIVMASFILLLSTLLSAYVQVVHPESLLPLLEDNGIINGIVELCSWTGLIAIVVLMVIRIRSSADHPLPAGLEKANDATKDAAIHAASSYENAGKIAATNSDIEQGEQPEEAKQVEQAERTAATIVPDTTTGRPQGELPQRFFGSTRWQARFVEIVILVVVICILTLHTLVYAYALQRGATGVTMLTFPLTSWIGNLLVSWHGLNHAIVVVATIKILTSMLWLMVVGVLVSMGVAWHRFLAIINLYAGREADGSKALGSLKPIYIDGQQLTDLEQLEEVDPEQLAPTKAKDLGWKAVTDLLTCTECGRCQELCPAWTSGKPLSPKLLIAQLRDHYVAQANFVTALGEDASLEDAIESQSGRWARDLLPHTADTLGALQAAGMTGIEGVPIEPVDLVDEVIASETLWACTTCGACVDACPVNIELLDHIVDLRREQALLAAAFPKDLAKAMKSLERRGNPFGQGAKKRMEWTADLDFQVPQIGVDIEDASTVDYLFWVGCAGAFDDRGKQTSAAVAKLLHHANVSFAVLGASESCTGDPARRAGNEVLFMTLAAANIEALNAAKVKRIIVSCAHCFNTLSREYPQFGGNFQVVHYTELVEQLLSDGRLQLADKNDENAAITYHDACYLGRHNGKYESPRKLIDIIGTRVEMPRNRDRALCCGAGGARAFMEESPAQRVSTLRMDEARQSGADIVATACPFCTTMLQTAKAPQSGEAQPAIRDIATLLAERIS